MTTNAEIVNRLERVADDAEYATKAYKEVLATEGEKDITLVDGSTTPNLNKRLRQIIGNTSPVESVNGMTGNVTISPRDIGALSANESLVQPKEDKYVITEDGRTQRQLNREIPQKANKTYVDEKLSGNANGYYASYETLTKATADSSKFSINSTIMITNDGARSGLYLWNGFSLTKSDYDPLTESKNYTNTKNKENYNTKANLSNVAIKSLTDVGMYYITNPTDTSEVFPDKQPVFASIEKYSQVYIRTIINSRSPYERYYAVNNLGWVEVVDINNQNITPKTISNTDANDFLISGVFMSQHTANNKNFPLPESGVLQVCGKKGFSAVSQVFISSQSKNMFLRVYFGNDGWGKWVKIKDIFKPISVVPDQYNVTSAGQKPLEKRNLSADLVSLHRYFLTAEHTQYSKNITPRSGNFEIRFTGIRTILGYPVYNLTKAYKDTYVLPVTSVLSNANGDYRDLGLFVCFDEKITHSETFKHTGDRPLYSFARGGIDLMVKLPLGSSWRNNRDAYALSFYLCSTTTNNASLWYQELDYMPMNQLALGDSGVNISGGMLYKPEDQTDSNGQKYNPMHYANTDYSGDDWFKVRLNCAKNINFMWKTGYHLRVKFEVLDSSKITAEDIKDLPTILCMGGSISGEIDASSSMGKLYSKSAVGE